MSSQNLLAPSLKEIESAIKQIDAKKDELKKAFDDLQAKALHLSSFSLSWPDLDSHFTAIQNSVTQRFRLLESRESADRPADAVPEHTGGSAQPVAVKQEDPSVSEPLTRQDGVESATDSIVNRPLDQVVQSNGEQPSTSNSLGLQSDGLAPGAAGFGSVVTRTKLKEFCERMDGKGLRKYVNDHQKERDDIRMAFPGALKSASDPGAMVLVAMEGFHSEKGDKDPELYGLRRVCVFLLELLMETGVRFTDEVRERAKQLALEWKGKLKMSKDAYFETLAFLHLVAAYGLGPVVDKEELVGYFVVIARHRLAQTLCRSIGLGEKVHDLIQKLLDSGKQLLAVRFVFEFGLAEKFPPVHLLKEYLKETTKLAKLVCENGKNSLKSKNEAAAKEIGALKAVIKVIEEHKLESEYPREDLQKRIELLEKQQADRKRPAAAPVVKPQQPQQQQPAKQDPPAKQQTKKKKQAQVKQQQSVNKRPRTVTPVVPMAASMNVACASSAVPPYQQSRLQPPGHSAAYLGSQAGPYGLAGSAHAVPPYAGSSGGLYGYGGAPMGFSMNQNPAAPHLYNSYDMRTNYGAYGLPPHYHPSYHPQ